MATAAGFMSRDTETSGSPTSRLRGRRIRRAAGFGNPITAGLGFLTSLGDGPLITMGVGSSIAEAGAGGLAQFMSAIGQCGRRPLYSLLASATVRASALAPSDGSRLARMMSSILGTDAALIASTGSM